MTLQHVDSSVTDDNASVPHCRRTFDNAFNNRFDLTICYDLNSVTSQPLYVEAIVISDDCLKIILIEFTHLPESTQPPTIKYSLS